MSKVREKRTSEILEEIISLNPSSDKISVQDFVTKLSDRAFGIGLGLALIIFGLVNAFIPGVSVIFAIPIFTLAGQMLLGQHYIWVPKWLAKKSFRENIVDKALRKIIPSMRFLEKFIKPRMSSVTDRNGEKLMAFLIILLNILVVPPIPGLNMIPSLCICLMALALLEDDGLLGILSIICSLIVIAFYYAAIILVAIAVVNGAEMSLDNIVHLFGKATTEVQGKIR